VVDKGCRGPASSVGTGTALPGQHPPDFTATTVDCKRLTLTEFTKGRPTLVDFYASWCAPCRNEARNIESIYEEWHSKNAFVVVGINTMDEKGGPDIFYKKYGWTFASVWDDQERILRAWDNKSGAISTLPAAFWIHSDGTVSDIVIGGMTHQQMEDEMRKLH
jgi:peroxiredoxin